MASNKQPIVKLHYFPIFQRESIKVNRPQLFRRSKIPRLIMPYGQPRLPDSSKIPRPIVPYGRLRAMPKTNRPLSNKWLLPPVQFQDFDCYNENLYSARGIMEVEQPELLDSARTVPSRQGQLPARSSKEPNSGGFSISVYEPLISGRGISYEECPNLSIPSPSSRDKGLTTPFLSPPSSRPPSRRKGLMTPSTSSNQDLSPRSSYSSIDDEVSTTSTMQMETPRSSSSISSDDVSSMDCITPMDLSLPYPSNSSDDEGSMISESDISSEPESPISSSSNSSDEVELTWVSLMDMDPVSVNRYRAYRHNLKTSPMEHYETIPTTPPCEQSEPEPEQCPPSVAEDLELTNYFSPVNSPREPEKREEKPNRDDNCSPIEKLEPKTDKDEDWELFFKLSKPNFFASFLLSPREPKPKEVLQDLDPIKSSPKLNFDPSYSPRQSETILATPPREKQEPEQRTSQPEPETEPETGPEPETEPKPEQSPPQPEPPLIPLCTLPTRPPPRKRRPGRPSIRPRKNTTNKMENGRVKSHKNAKPRIEKSDEASAKVPTQADHDQMLASAIYGVGITGKLNPLLAMTMKKAPPKNRKPIPTIVNLDEEMWDPMTEAYESILNNRVDGPIDASYMITGYNTSKLVQCKFHDGFSGNCFKGPRCIYKHDKYAGGLMERLNPNLGFRRDFFKVPVLEDLADKPILRCNSVFFGHFAKCIDPHNFYVIPDDLSCLCEYETKEKPHEPNVTYQALAGINGYESMAKHMAAKWSRLIQSTDYSINELIVIKCKNIDGGSTFLRGYITENFVYDNVPIGSRPKIKYNLVDWPEIHGEKPPKEIARLPIELVEFPPMVYCVSLFGVSPVGADWSEDTKEDFKSNYQFKKALFIIKNEAVITEDTWLHEQDHPYQAVVLDYGGTKGENVTDVALKMAEAGRALYWNPVEKRPLAMLNIDPTQHIYFKENIQPADLKQLYKEERKRLRIKVDFPNVKKKVEYEKGDPTIHLEGTHDDSQSEEETEADDTEEEMDPNLDTPPPSDHEYQELTDFIF